MAVPWIDGAVSVLSLLTNEERVKGTGQTGGRSPAFAFAIPSFLAIRLRPQHSTFCILHPTFVTVSTASPHPPLHPASSAPSHIKLSTNTLKQNAGAFLLGHTPY